MSVSDDTTGLRGDPVRDSPLRVGDLLIVSRGGTWVFMGYCERNLTCNGAIGFVWVLHTGRWEFARAVIDQKNLCREDRVIS